MKKSRDSSDYQRLLKALRDARLKAGMTQTEAGSSYELTPER